MVHEVRKLTMQPTNATFSDLLDQQTEFHIPLYQRDYTWTSDEINDFIEDALTAFDLRTTRFFGTILVSDTTPDQKISHDRSVIYVIDGQQRLTTTLICLVVLRHMVLELQDLYPKARDTAERIHMRLTVETEDHEKRAPRLYANRENSQFLRQMMAKTTETREETESIYVNLPTKSSQRSSSRLRDAYQSAYKQMRNELVSRTTGVPIPPDEEARSFRSYFQDAVEAESASKKISDFFSHFLRYSQLVKIHITEWLEAFDLFDGLNNRGMELAKRDVLKNVLLSRAAREDDEELLKVVEQTWTSFERLLPENAFAKFLRHFLLLNHDQVSLSGATRIYIEETKNESAQIALSNLVRAAECYRNIIEPTSDPDMNKDVVQHLENLRSLSAERVRPIILACLLQKIPDKPFKQLLRTLEVLYFRRSTICQQDNKSLEGLVQKIASAIYQNGSTAIEQALHALKAENPKDDLFIKMFESKIGMPAQAARYMLLELENFHIKNGELSVSGGTLEHILPQEPGEFWDLDKNDPEIKELIDRLGNLTLLRQTENSKARNRPFLEKLEIYGAEDESLRINQGVLGETSWQRKEIEARQKQMAIWASKAWAV